MMTRLSSAHERTEQEQPSRSFCLSRKGSISIHIFLWTLSIGYNNFFYYPPFSHTQSRSARRMGGERKARSRRRVDEVFPFPLSSGGQVRAHKELIIIKGSSERAREGTVSSGFGLFSPLTSERRESRVRSLVASAFLGSERMLGQRGGSGG